VRKGSDMKTSQVLETSKGTYIVHPGEIISDLGDRWVTVVCIDQE